MPKYYYTLSANRQINTGGFNFQFDPIEQFGGNWTGVIKLEEKDKIKAFGKVAVELGMTELTELDYLKELKKKMVFMKSSANSLVRQSPQTLINHPAKAAIKEVTSRLTVEEPLPTSQDAIQVGKAPYLDPITRTQPPKQHYAKGWQ